VLLGDISPDALLRKANWSSIWKLPRRLAWSALPSSCNVQMTLCLIVKWYRPLVPAKCYFSKRISGWGCINFMAHITPGSHMEACLRRHFMSPTQPIRSSLDTLSCQLSGYSDVLRRWKPLKNDKSCCQWAVYLNKLSEFSGLNIHFDLQLVNYDLLHRRAAQNVLQIILGVLDKAC